MKEDIESKMRENIESKMRENIESKMRENIELKMKGNIMSRYKVLDMFCGCGGFTKGLEDAGLDVVAGIDVCGKAIESYNENFDKRGILSDVSDVDLKRFEDVDIVVGSPPCQGFSLAGKRDAKDPRNLLPMEFVRYVNTIRPKAFLMENVVGFMSMKNSDGEKIVDSVMSNINGYKTNINVLCASDFGVPQNRKRVIIIGVRDDLDVIPTDIAPVLDKKDRVPVKTVLTPREDVEEKCYLSERAISGILRRKAECKKSKKGFGAQYLREDKPSYTISARYWKDGYDALVKYSDTEIRRLTVDELKRIQTFPEDFYIAGTKKEVIIQIGNAVACLFAKHLGEYLINILQK